MRYIFYIQIFIVLNEKDRLDVDISWQSEKQLQNKSDFEDIFSGLKKSEIIEKEYEALQKMIENLIRSNFLKKEYYEDLPDWTNPEIDNICNHSASDIENRIKEGKGILFMNPCISQTLYLVNKLKKGFSHLSEYMDLCVETLKLTKLNIRSVHAFIKINMPHCEPIIIDYAHDNDVYIYQWKYMNRWSLAIKTEDLRTVPVNSFSENDNIFDIAMKWHMLDEWDFDPSSQELHNKFFLEMLNSRKEQLRSHNTRSRFENRQEKNKEIRIFNLLRS